MKHTSIFALALLTLFAFAAFGQSTAEIPGKVRGRVVVTNTMPPIKPAATPVAIPESTPIVVGGSERSALPASTSNKDSTVHDPNGKAVSFGFIKRQIAEAKREMQQRPMATASSSPTDGSASGEFVRIAFHDWKTGRTDFVTLTKDSFLSTDSEKAAISENGRHLTIKTIRGNGVNTPVTLTDERGEAELPLLVQYPVVRGGKYYETAYYMSTHPGLVTPEVVNAGRFYVHNVIELARERLQNKGIMIAPKVADIAERLAGVEHVDHYRFRTEPPADVFNDIYTLYALNEGQTYRYSVSSAGAGGMVQMIPSTYRMVRSWHANVPLMPDFVEGMRNHVNATEAMLLYMQRTWNDLIASPTVADAFSNGTATQEQLMAAGYNSNPARIAGYIRRGGENWTSLIPRETQIYLQIFDAIETFVPMKPRTR